jgi:amino acid adenylation domain-containing protein
LTLQQVRQIGQCYEQALASLTARPGDPCHRNLLPPGEADQVRRWSRVSAEFPQERTVVDRFEQQAAAGADRVALVCQGRRLRYEELNRRANQLAHQLIAQGIGEGRLVAICAERSVEMVVGLLAILKAGGAYLPLDPDLPPERLRLILEDSQVGLVLCQEHLVPKVDAAGATLLPLDLDHPACLASSPDNPARRTAPDQLAYVIYTSGSTGRPKGCLITHANLGRLFDATQAWFQFDENDVWTLFHSYAFDFSVWEIWGALLYGGRLVMVPYFTSRSPEEFHRLLGEERVTVLNQTPSAFYPLCKVGAPPASLRLVIFGGETLDFGLVQPWMPHDGAVGPRLVNMYGITETTVHVTYFPIPVGQDTAPRLIGIPLPDLSTWILDNNRQPVPLGVAGEIYVGGAGVARGYLRRPELDAEKFVAVELFGEAHRLYRSGDAGRWLPDGNLEYLGRLDHQVKIRGFRIELGEIETVLRQHPEVDQAVVILWPDARGSAGPVPVAYLTLRADAKGGEGMAARLRGWLLARLPDYMCPASFTVVERLPLTANGKLDRPALPAPDFTVETEPEAPRNEIERLLAQLWSTGTSPASAPTSSRPAAIRCWRPGWSRGSATASPWRCRCG